MARFRAEAQAVAHLQHPNICVIVGRGATKVLPPGRVFPHRCTTMDASIDMARESCLCGALEMYGNSSKHPTPPPIRMQPCLAGQIANQNG
jgi:hypothetical protein